MTTGRGNRSLRALDWLNFFLADVQTGVGPFLAVYLSASHWNAQQVGLVLTFGGLAGVIAQTSAGALVDVTHRKRLLLSVGIACVSTASFVLALQPMFWSVIGAQLVLGSVGAFLALTVTAITLGIVLPEEFDQRFGRNQTFNSAGNVASALLMGGIGYAISNRAIFVAVPFLAIPCLFALLAIDPTAVDYARSRGLRNRLNVSRSARFRVLLSDRRLLAFASCAVLFHFANAAMLP